MPIDRAQVRELAGFYRKYLLDDVMAFWETRAADDQQPGHFHLFDRTGKHTGTDKYIWCQGRQTWMFANLYNDMEQRDNWLALARTGRDLLVNHAHAGNGRFHYRLHRDGSVADDSRSWFTDAFALIGLCEHAVASGSDEDLPLIQQTFDTFERNFHQPGFSEYHHFKIDPTLRYHGPSMIGVGMAPVLRKVLAEQRFKGFVDECLNRVLCQFAKDEHQVLFEVLDGDGTVLNTPAGQTINPGHTLESMWFCLEEARHRGDGAAADRAVEVTRWGYDNGLDPELGGLFAFTSPEGGMPTNGDQSTGWGERWDTKIWWVHSEAIYALALAALVKEDQGLWSRFLAQHEYWQRNFADREYGEWYAYLERDGTPRLTDKGTWVKSAFHIPRALAKLVLLLEREGEG